MKITIEELIEWVREISRERETIKLSELIEKINNLFVNINYHDIETLLLKALSTERKLAAHKAWLEKQAAEFDSEGDEIARNRYLFILNQLNKKEGEE